MKAEALGHCRRAFQLLPARGRRSKTQAAHAVPAGRLPRFGLQLAVKLGRIAHQARQVAAAAQLTDETGGMPCRAVSQLQTLEQDDVALPALDEVIGDAAADDAAADDDDPAPRGHWHEKFGHLLQIVDNLHLAASNRQCEPTMLKLLKPAAARAAATPPRPAVPRASTRRLVPRPRCPAPASERRSSCCNRILCRDWSSASSNG